MELFNYLLKVSACSALFFAFYLLVLRKLTFFKINRFYLLFSVVISFIIPALQFTIEREEVAPLQPIISSPINTNPDVFQAPITVSSIAVKGAGSFNWLDVLPIVYGVIVLSLLLIAIFRVVQLLKQAKAPVKEINGLKLVVKQKGFTNCSFFNYVFIDENSLTQAELAVLLTHEEVHAKQYHSVDKLILMIAKAVLWFNPIIYLYDRAIEEVHEYEADETTSENVGMESYATLLLKLAVSKNSNPFIHNFVKSPIKQRIKMLFNSKSKSMKKLAYLIILPIGLCLIWSFTVKVVYAKTSVKEVSSFTTEATPALKTLSVNIPEKTKPVLTPAKQKVALTNDTVRLVGPSSLGKNPKVIIDDVSYGPEILTKISPKSIKAMITAPNFIKIATSNNKIEYASKIEIENFKVLKTINNNQLYLKYPQRRENGERYEVVKVNSANGSFSMDVPNSSKVLILIGNSKYTEAEAKAMNKSIVTDGGNIIERTMPGFATRFPQYVGKYDVVVTLPEPKQPNSSESKL